MFHVSVGRLCFLAILGIVSLLVFSLTLDARAAEGINRQIPFQGTLKDAPSGRPVTGNRDMVFRIYDAPTGGNLLWTGNHTTANGNVVSVNDGIFSVMLGSGTGNALTLDFTEDTYYLGVTVGTDPEMTPRERLGASPYAFNADFLDGFDSDDFLRKGTTLSVTGETDTPFLTLTQQGVGNFVSFFDGTDTELFSVLGTGEVIGTKFQSTLDEVNTFAGPLEILSGDSSVFGGNIVISDGSGISFGNGNGVLMYQDASVASSVQDLVLAGAGPDESGYVNITTAGGLWLTPNNFNGCTDGCEPTFRLNETGSIEMSNTTYGDSGERQLRLNLKDGVLIKTGGMVLEEGDLTLSNGDVSIEGTNTLGYASLFVSGSGGLRVDNLAQDAVPGYLMSDTQGNVITSSLTKENIDLVDGRVTILGASGLRVENLADATDLVADSQGNIISNPSDERLKENIRTIDGALGSILELRGVRYEWRDKERFGAQTEVGFVAQEVQEVLPEVVRDTGEYFSLNTKNITAVIVEAVKEMYAEMQGYFSRTEELEREVELLKREIEMLKQDGNTNEEPTPAPEETISEEIVEEPSQIPSEEVSSELPIESEENVDSIPEETDSI